MGAGGESRQQGGSSGLVAILFTDLLPFTGRFNWTGTSIADANDLGLAMAAATLGDDDRVVPRATVLLA